MLELKRITTLYEADQDRMSLTAQLGDGSFARIWLTQRIVNRLIPALINQVRPDHVDGTYADVIAGVAQQRAVERHEPQAPVRAAEAGHEWLVSKINMQIGQNGAILSFCNADGETAKLAMNAELLRQWLAILRRVYLMAEWQGADWPRWMATPSTPDTATKVLH
jgi:hypothetical protein